MSARLGVAATDEIGLIHLDQPLAFADPPTLGDLRAAGVPYEREIVSGRGLADADVETVLRLGGSPLDQRR